MFILRNAVGCLSLPCRPDLAARLLPPMSCRMLVLSCLVAVAAALQPSQMLSTRSAQVAQRTPAPEMKRPDYFLRVSRSEAGRPRLCVFRWAFAADTGPGVKRIVLVSCTPSSGPLRLRRT